MSGIDVVIHAAALKQVPALEYNPMEAVKTNIDGAENVINAAIDSGVKKVMAPFARCWRNRGMTLPRLPITLP